MRKLSILCLLCLITVSCRGLYNLRVFLHIPESLFDGTILLYEDKHKLSDMENEKQKTDPQQTEIDGNVLGKAFESIAGDTKGRQAGVDKPASSQTAGVDDEEQKD